MIKHIAIWALFLLANPAHAVTYFSYDGESGYQYLGVGNAHPGGGYFSSLGGTVAGSAGTGCSNPDTYHNTILSNDVAAQGAVTGSQYALKTPYDGDCPNESFSRDTTVIMLTDSVSEYYVQWYQKWTGDWNSCDTQQKFVKFYNIAENFLTAHFSFGAEAETWRNYMVNLEGRFDMLGVDHAAEVWVYETQAGAGSQYTGVNRAWDDINNGIGVGGTDAQATFVPGTWYCIEIHSKLNSDADTADAVCEAWVDGVKVFEVTDFKFYASAGDYAETNCFELQHIYYNRSATDQPTYMDNIVISDTYIGYGGSPDPPGPPGPGSITSGGHSTIGKGGHSTISIGE